VMHDLDVERNEKLRAMETYIAGLEL
jgi:hypothetical protein